MDIQIKHSHLAIATLPQFKPHVVEILSLLDTLSLTIRTGTSFVGRRAITQELAIKLDNYQYAISGYIQESVN